MLRYLAWGLAALLLSAVTCSAASFTAVRSGIWTDTSAATSPWCNSAASCTTALQGSGPGGVPGFGDTITAGWGYLITCPAGTTCKAGTDVAGNIAFLRDTTNNFQCGSVSIGDGATLELYGSYATNCWTPYASTPLLKFSGAATLVFRGTGSWVLGPTINGGQHANDNIVVSGTTATRRARIESQTATASRITGTSFGVGCQGCMGISDGAGGPARFVDFVGLGDASTAGYSFNGGSTAFVLDLADYSFSDCGALSADVRLNTGAQVRLRRGVHLWNPATYDIDIAFPSSTTGSGEFLLEDLVTLKRVRMNGQYVTMNRVLLSGLATNANLGAWKIWKSSILRKTYPDDQTIAGPMTDVMFVFDNNGENQHSAFMATWGFGIANMIDGLYLDSATYQSNGGANHDIGDGWLSNDTGSITPFYIRRMITGLSPDGLKAASNAFTLFSNQGNFKLYTANNTGVGPAPTFMSVQENASAPGQQTGQVVGFMNTLLDWGGFTSSTSIRSKARITSPRSPTSSDIFVPAKTDYNAAYQCVDTDPVYGNWANAGKCYHVPWSVAPGTPGGAGTHDVDVLDPNWTGPRFIDRTRSTPLFDTQFLGNSAPAWNLGSTYARGMVVSYAKAGWYAGQTVNYVCVSRSGCPANVSASEPVAGSSWRSYWSFATFWRVAQAIQNGSNAVTSRFGQNLSYVETIMAWFREGFTPTNPAVWNAGCLDANYDGVCEGSTHIGAVDPAPLKRAAGAVLLP